MRPEPALDVLAGDDAQARLRRAERACGGVVAPCVSRYTLAIVLVFGMLTVPAALVARKLDYDDQGKTLSSNVHSYVGSRYILKGIQPFLSLLSLCFF